MAHLVLFFSLVATFTGFFSPGISIHRVVTFRYKALGYSIHQKRASGTASNS